MTLTVKQQKFVSAYVESGNATKAALDAGYSKRTARTVGSQNLAKLDIKSAIADRMKQIEDAKIAKADEVLRYLTTVLRGEATESVNVGTSDGVVTIDDNPPTIKDRMAAGKELLKRYPDSDELLEAQVRRAKAEADIAEARAADATDDDQDGGVTIVDDIPDTDDTDTTPAED
ncbi:terminase small subunit [Lacticaseibacillus songhuajiangensis]|uniref:terminase small subunit n=1 Tax=Lacticaseibacillus songhuajiangensis TaxID=1296539 RepID=UPI000F7A6754|nr:terminase small subunit [Lacticaseibacillus songhuajiangensis]